MMTFGEAIEAAKKGQRIARAGWNGKGQYVYAAKLTQSTEPCMVIRNAQALHQPGWLASQGDMFAEDWEVLNLL